MYHKMCTAGNKAKGTKYIRISHQVLLLLSVLTLIHKSSSLVDCHIACRRCHAEYDIQAILEVYCAMCKECKSRRKVARRRTTQHGEEKSSDVGPGKVKHYARMHEPKVTYPTGCPTPPLCEDIEEVPLKLSNQITTTTTLPPSTCPPITTCRKRKKPCQSCIPICPCPAMIQPTEASTAVVDKLSAPTVVLATPESEKSKDFQYVYVGIPKHVVKVGNDEYFPPLSR